jgi:hypothetical protein
VGLFAGAPGKIHSLQRIENRAPIGFVISQNSFTPISNFVMKAHRFGIEASQCDGILQIVEKQTRLLWNLIERQRLNAESGLFRSAVTGSFGGAQFWGSLLKGQFYASYPLCASEESGHKCLAAPSPQEADQLSDMAPPR